MSAVLGKPGVLYIVATPIGNLADVTERAISILAGVDLIAAEDTRHSRPLLTKLGISTRVISLHEHNEKAKSSALIARLLKGENIALISDAGTPLISDPGHELVNLAHQNQIKVVPVPGASAVLSALSVAGISAADYRFIGFLPAKPGQRRSTLTNLAASASTLVLFESPHRIVASLADCADILGATRQACFCRELTKKFETVYRAPLGEILEFVSTQENQQRGEMVLVIHGSTSLTDQQDDLDQTKLLTLLLQHLSVKDAAGILARLTGRSRNYFYQLGLTLKRR